MMSSILTLEALLPFTTFIQNSQSNSGIRVGTTAIFLNVKLLNSKFVSGLLKNLAGQNAHVRILYSA